VPDAERPRGLEIHSARLWGGRDELLWGAAVWEELEQRGATIAIVPFWGRAGQGGTIATITLSRVEDGALVDVERWSSRDELRTPWRRRCGIGSDLSSGSPSSGAR
jgi:hypothetical protein